MRLKIKKFKWFTGRPVVFLHPKTTARMNIFQNDRVSLSLKGQNISAIVNVVSGIIKHDEIGLSEEIFNVFDIKKEKTIDVTPSEMSPASVIIKKKLLNNKLTKEEIEIVINEIVKNNLTEGEIAYFVAAQMVHKMTIQECVYLTDAMVKSGLRLEFNSNDNIVDKHCIGGIAGNRTTPIVVCICAVAGLKIPKTSSRAITSAAGTADVIETIANVELNPKELQDIVNKHNACLAWGGGIKLSPSDDKIIQLERLLNLDVESQLLASIMSKKIAAGSKKILIDIPYGNGAKFSNIEQAKSLGNKFRQIAKYFDVKIDTAFTDGSQPIGNGIGANLEMFDVIKVLKCDSDAPLDLREKSLELAERLLRLGNIKDPKTIAKEILDSGKAYQKFVEIVNAQNNSNDFDSRVKKLSYGKFKKDILAKRSGEITRIDNKEINLVSRILGCPEIKTAGIYLNKHVGPVKKGDIIMTLYSEDVQKIEDAEGYLTNNEVFIIKN